VTHAQTWASYSTAYRFGSLSVVNANSTPRLVDFNYCKSSHIDAENAPADDSPKCRESAE